MTAAALLYQPRHRWRVGVTFGAAALIHFAAIALANVHRTETTGGPPFTDEFPEVTFESPPTVDDPTTESSDLLPTPPPQIDEFIAEQTSTPPPIRRQIKRPAVPIVNPRNNGSPGASSWSSAKVLAVTNNMELYHNAAELKLGVSDPSNIQIERAP